jgi:hypothetical protein
VGTDEVRIQVERLPTLPPGLRAMAATHELDVSMALDDLGWHFGNWPDLDMARETALGLRELGATEAAEIFEAALEIVRPRWDELATAAAGEGDAWIDWYNNRGLQEALDPLNDRMWKLLEPLEWRLMQYWIEYARKFPHRVTQQLH